MSDDPTIGRPSHGVTEATETFKLPLVLRDRMAAWAKKHGITKSEAWRRAARALLGMKPDAYEKYLNEKDADE